MFIDIVYGLVFGVGVLLFSLSGGFAFWAVTLKEGEAEDLTAKKIELFFFAVACLVFSLLIAYWLS